MYIMYNFRNIADEEMVQQELECTPTGQDFIKKWTWPQKPGCSGRPRFRRTNTIEDYLYIRVIDADRLIGIGAIRIHWNTEGNFMFDNTLQVIHKQPNYYVGNPADTCDIEGIIRDKLYKYLMEKIMHGRRCDDIGPEPCPVRPCPPPPPPKPPAPPPPKRHPHRNLPKAGPYGAEYNAWDDVCPHPHMGDYEHYGPAHK